jgi:membrane-bound lytic murein transglycosylase D
MLKTQFAKAFYLCNSFLLISTPFTANPIPYNAGSFRQEKNGIETAFLSPGSPTNRNILPGHVFYPFKTSPEPLSKEPQRKLNRKGILFVKKYIKNSCECLISVKNRSMIPFFIIDSVFKLYGLPVELKYLAVIESELKPSALSRVGARGPWQFMPGTAQDLGLKIISNYDERTNYYKSTRAAARYLKDLYAQFGDWLLVLAAYNGGPKPVYTAIRKSGSRNFWVLQDYLPVESREHVKKFIATHYYFEGRGSETTLTKAENMEYAKTLSEFAAYHPEAEISVTQKVNSGNPKTTQKRENLAVNYDARQKPGSENNGTDKNSKINQGTVRQFESSEHKFKRLMKESEECLKRSSKMI